MNGTEVNLAALVGSRICHDLISPVGAVANGLELLELAGAARGEELDLIAGSVSDADARIRFMRIAFGAPGDQPVSRSEVISILAATGRSGRVQVDWAVAGDASRAEVQLAFLALQCLETALPRGGQIRVEMQGTRWNLTGRGPKLAMEPGLWGRLTDDRPLPGLTPAQVQFALLPQAAARLGRRIRVTPVDAGIAIEF